MTCLGCLLEILACMTLCLEILAIGLVVNHVFRMSPGNTSNLAVTVSQTNYSQSEKNLTMIKILANQSTSTVPVTIHLKFCTHRTLGK